MSLIKFQRKVVPIRILIEIPKQWVDLTLKIHGPNKPGDVVLLDKETAEYFIKYGWGKYVE
ncbi:MAG: hypothetical protein ACP5F8_02645 [Candidatus Aenigmatarchaeota archaeon]